MLSLEPISQYFGLLFLNSSHSKHNSGLCGLNCGSFITALAQKTFNDYIFQIIFLCMNSCLSQTTITKTTGQSARLHTLFKTEKVTQVLRNVS
jgi:hypothetical protein